SGERRLRLVDQRLEGFRLADGEIGEHLAVDLDPGLAEAVDKSAVGHAELAHGGIDALDPQGTEGALARLAVAIGVLLRLLGRRMGGADRILAPAIIALGGLQDLLVPGMGGDAPLDSRHGTSPRSSADRR